MKFTTVLASAAVAHAIPGESHAAQDMKDIAISNFSAASFNQTSPQTRTITLSLDDPNTGVKADCRADWFVGDKEEAPRYNCTDPAYQLQLSSDPVNIEQWVLCIFKPDLTEVGAVDINMGKDWQCKKTPGQQPDEVCNWNGILSLPVGASD